MQFNFERQKIMPEFEVKVKINKPLETVYSEFMNFENMNKWLTGFRGIETLHGAEGKVGSKYRITFEEDGKEIFFIEEVTGIKENEEFSFRMHHDSFSSENKIRFRRLATQTEVLSRVQAKGNNLLWKLLLPLMKNEMQKRQEKDFIKLKNFVESKN
ncbi:MAG: SRPBCC family protein [Calditrichaeota bacterium]|nr:MAG: SRPBCC family protein [Calditrichota bacterium]